MKLIAAPQVHVTFVLYGNNEDACTRLINIFIYCPTRGKAFYGWVYSSPVSIWQSKILPVKHNFQCGLPSYVILLSCSGNHVELHTLIVQLLWQSLLSSYCVTHIPVSCFHFPFLSHFPFPLSLQFRANNSILTMIVWYIGPHFSKHYVQDM